jgi:hypothetical protein
MSAQRADYRLQGMLESEAHNVSVKTGREAKSTLLHAGWILSSHVDPSPVMPQCAFDKTPRAKTKYVQGWSDHQLFKQVRDHARSSFTREGYANG